MMPLTLPRKLCSVVGERNRELCNYAIAGESTRMIARVGQGQAFGGAEEAPSFRKFHTPSPK
jgi:hypothetical protein